MELRWRSEDKALARHASRRLESTWAFQVGSSQSVVVSPSKFSGAVSQCTSHSKSTYNYIIHTEIIARETSNMQVQKIADNG